MVLSSNSMKGQIMSKPQEINSTPIQQIFDELDHPEPIVASPRFYKRVMQRIQVQEVGELSRSRQWLRPALLAAMIVLNLMVMTQVWCNLQQGAESSDQATRGISVLAEEYGYDLDSDFWSWSGE